MVVLGGDPFQGGPKTVVCPLLRDVATAGVAYALGFGLDAFFFSGGVSSGATGGACAAGAIGAKYSLQELFRKRGKRQKKPTGSSRD